MKLEDNDPNKWSKIMKQKDKVQFVGSSDIEDMPKNLVVKHDLTAHIILCITS
jgi:hypothetical protein